MFGILKQQAKRVAIPRRIQDDVMQIWALQHSLTQIKPAPEALLRHPRFRAALDFLHLRSHFNAKLSSFVTHWQTQSNACAQ